MEISPYEYDCGARAGQSVRLRHDHLPTPDKLNSAGEVWQVQAGPDRATLKRPITYVVLHDTEGVLRRWAASIFWESFELVPHPPG